MYHLHVFIKGYQKKVRKMNHMADNVLLFFELAKTVYKPKTLPYLMACNTFQIYYCKSL